MKRYLGWLISGVFLFLHVPPALAVNDAIAPEISTKRESDFSRKASTASSYMVSAANQLASEAGARILRGGGNALDAAIATQMVLNVVEPQSSGIGGGAFLLYYEAASHKLYALDGRETAPTKALPTQFLDADGAPLPFEEAVKGGRSVATPGLLKLLYEAHRRFGHTEWPALFADAIRLARDGFPLSERLHGLLVSTPHIHEFSDSMRPYSAKDGTLKPVGATIKNPQLAETFSNIAAHGITDFYEGALAEEIAQAVQKSPINPGSLNVDDLHNYSVKERLPICHHFLIYNVCSMPPPSSGGIAILQTLTILDALTTRLQSLPPTSPDAIHLISEAMRLAYADRNAYVGDPDFVHVPTSELLDDSYLKQRALLISSKSIMPNVKPGIVSLAQPPHAATEERPSTTHISIVDAEGNIVAMTSSIEYGFGSGVSVAGFLLNNQLTDFNFSPVTEDGKTPHPNRLEPGKRPRSSMSPTIVFNERNEPFLTIGSPGGARIIAYVLQTLLGVLVWDMDVQQAINQPHFLNMQDKTELEKDRISVPIAEQLKSRNHVIEWADLNSGIHAVEKLNDGQLQGGADPRREGIAIGE